MFNKNNKKWHKKQIIVMLVILALIAFVSLFCIFKATSKPPLKWHERKLIGGKMDYQLYWAMSLISTGFGDIGEYLDTASRIKEGDYENWYQEWNKTAERIHCSAENSLARGHNVSAGDAYLRSAAYYRMADFYYALNLSNPRYLEAARKCEDSFIKGMKLQSVPMEAVEIPYEKTTLRGYLFLSPISKEKAPIIIVQAGFDTWAEEMLYVAFAAMKRGYHCLLFNGTGQGMVVREENLKFRPDWEAVITPVVNFVQMIPGVDPKRIALMGSSMGGALVTRAVAYEERIKACIVSPGYYDLYDAFLGSIPKSLLKLIISNPNAFDKVMQSYLKKSWGFSHAMYVFGVEKPSELATGAQKYRYENDIIKIKCNMLIMDGMAEEILGAGQPKKLYDALKCPKTYMLFTAEDVAELHCQVGALNFANERMFNWLDEFFKK